MDDQLANEITLRAVYLDDLIEDHSVYMPHIARVLGRIHSSPTLEPVSERPALEGALIKRPHFAFIDNDLGHGKENDGVRIISDLKPRSPDTIFVLFTGRTIRAEDFGTFTPNPDFFIAKQYIGTSEYDEYVFDSLRKLLRRLPLPLSIQTMMDLKREGPRHGGGGRLTGEELLSLVEQVTHPGSDVSGVDGIAGIQLAPMPGGFSGAGVYSFRTVRLDGVSSAPAVLKIADTTRSIEEHANYLRHVKWRLPYTWRVDVLGSGNTGNFGAVCYSFAMGGGGEPKAVNAYLRAGSTNVIDLVLASVLHSKNQTWYSERRNSKVDARDYFGGRRFYRSNRQREDRQRRLLEGLAQHAKSFGEKIYFESDEVTLGTLSFPIPNRALFNREWGIVSECVCHGDLNGNNILYSDDGKNVVFIDFQATGFWHVFRDFISFESGVRLELPIASEQKDLDPGERFVAYVKEELALNSDRWEQTGSSIKYLSECTKVRLAAHENFSDETYDLYCIANIVHSMWLFDKAEKWGVEKQIRLLACVVGGLMYLDRARPWPRRGTK